MLCSLIEISSTMGSPAAFVTPFTHTPPLTAGRVAEGVCFREEQARGLRLLLATRLAFGIGRRGRHGVNERGTDALNEEATTWQAIVSAGPRYPRR